MADHRLPPRPRLLRASPVRPPDADTCYFQTGLLEFSTRAATVHVPYVLVAPHALPMRVDEHGNLGEERSRRLLELGMHRLTDINGVLTPATRPWTAVLAGNTARITSRFGDVLADVVPYDDEWPVHVQALGGRVSVLYAPGTPPSLAEATTRHEESILPMMEKAIAERRMVGGMINAQRPAAR